MDLGAVGFLGLASLGTLRVGGEDLEAGGCQVSLGGGGDRVRVDRADVGEGRVPQGTWRLSIALLVLVLVLSRAATVLVLVIGTRPDDHKLL